MFGFVSRFLKFSDRKDELDWDEKARKFVSSREIALRIRDGIPGKSVYRFGTYYYTFVPDGYGEILQVPLKLKKWEREPFCAAVSVYLKSAKQNPKVTIERSEGHDCVVICT
ncbi:hypothetical protein EOL73_04805 [Candidatus Saccharibacteria bacterium]|nr:hypothetical protein [Candidatus Saccharibacteria bacterium]NCU41041.1 hypothetical protein [Candidatus Saccharibacteria bacterium]